MHLEIEQIIYLIGNNNFTSLHFIYYELLLVDVKQRVRERERERERKKIEMEWKKI